jgi:hypothetical protein
MQEFYAYTHARPDGRVFYVGKGCGDRAYSFLENRNKHYLNTVRKYGTHGILVGKIPCSSEESALELEKGLIKCFRRMGVALVNQTDGGDGISGYKWTNEQLVKLHISRLKDSQRPHRREQSRQQMLTSNPMYNADVREKHLTNLRKATSSEQFKIKQSMVKLGNSHTKDYVWLNDGVCEWLVHKDATEIQSSIKGRLPRVWVYNERGSRFIPKSEADALIESGAYSKGRKLNKENAA